jgi:hypothetical protein
MKTQFEYDGEIFQFERNWFTGMFKCIVKNKTIVIENPMNPLTHFWLTLKRQKEVSINGNLLLVIHKRSLWFSFAKPHEYEFWINGELVHKHEG